MEDFGSLSLAQEMDTVDFELNWSVDNKIVQLNILKICKLNFNPLIQVCVQIKNPFSITFLKQKWLLKVYFKKFDTFTIK